MPTGEELRAARIREALDAAGIDLGDPRDRTAMVRALTGDVADRKLTPKMKQLQCLELRAAGASFDQIAEVVGYASRGAAHKATMTALQAMVYEGVEELRALELGRLDSMLAGGLYTKALKGDVTAIDRVLKIMDARRRLVAGLEVPTPKDEAAANGFAGHSPIVVELSIPLPEDTTPVPQHELPKAQPVIDVASTVASDDVSRGDR